jgi:hypothetical protein
LEQHGTPFNEIYIGKQDSSWTSVKYLQTFNVCVRGGTRIYFPNFKKIILYLYNNLKKMNTTKPQEMYGVTFRNKVIRERLLDIQFDLWKATGKKHSMEAVLEVLLDTYKSKNK